MKLKEALEKAKKCNEFITTVEATNSQENYVNLQNYHTNKFVYSRIMKAVTAKVIEKSDYNKVLNAMPEEDRESLKSFFIRGLPKFVKEADPDAYKAIMDLLNNQEVDRLVEYNKLFETFKDETKKILAEAKITNTKDRIKSLLGKKDYKESEKILLDVMGDELNNDIEIPDELALDVFENPEMADDHPYAEKIEKIIKTLDPEKDKEKIAALKEANEYIISGKDDFRSLTMKVAENFGAKCDKEQSDLVFEEAVNRGSRGKLVLNTFSTKDDKEITELIDVCIEKHFNLNYIDDKKLISVSKFIEENGILNDSIMNAEEGSKIYSMRALVEKAFEVKKAIDENRLDDLVELNKEYQKLDKAYETITKQLGDMDYIYIPGNVSSSREALVPAKYRNNYLGVSKLTSIWMLNKLCKQAEITVEEFVQKPFESILKFGEIAIKDASPEVYSPGLKLENHLDQITGRANAKEFNKAKNVLATLSMGAGRGLSAITIFGNRVGSIRGEEQISMTLAALVGVQNGLSNINDDVRTKLVENFIVSEPKDRNLVTMSTGVTSKKMGEAFQPFDKQKYIESGKTSVESIIKRMADLKTLEDNRYQKNITNVANFVKGLNVEKTANANKFLDIIANPNARLYSGDIKAINARTTLTNELKNDGAKSINDIGESIKNLADMQKDYNSRNFIKKLFGSGTKRLKSELDDLKKVITTKTNITNDELKNAINVSMNETNAAPLNTTTEAKAPVVDESVRKNIEVDTDIEIDNSKEVEKTDSMEKSEALEQNTDVKEI